MEIFITGTRALALLRESRRGDAPPIRAASHTPSGHLERQALPLDRLSLIAPVALADVSDSQPIEVVVQNKSDRIRASGVCSHVCKTSHQQSFVRLAVSAQRLVASGLPDNLEIYLDSACRCFLVFAQTLARLVRSGRIDRKEATMRLLVLGSELCGTYARDPGNPRKGKITFNLPKASSVDELRDYLAACKDAEGIFLARGAASYLVEGFRSPLEAEFYYALTLPPRLGGLSFPKPLINMPLIVENNASPDPLSREYAGAIQQSAGHATHHGVLTPDLHWPLADLGLVVEVDGYAYHSDKTTFLDDRLRDQDYRSLGFQVLRATYANASSREELESFLSLVISVTAQKMPAERVANLRRNLRNAQASELRKRLVSVFGTR